jgi:adenylate kinase family enzyme
LTDQIESIEYTIEGVKSARSDIEKDIRAEYAQIVENLRSEEGKKLAILQYDSAVLQKEANKIQDILNLIEDINQCDSPDMISFLLKYKRLEETVQTTLVKPFKKTIDVVTDDFPRELDQRRAKLETLQKMKSLVKVKDDIICNLIQERKNREDEETLKLKEKTRNEIAEWAKLSDKYAMELKKYHLVCHYCGLFLSEDIVNANCPKNTQENVDKANFSLKSVSNEFLNSKRHYFGPPTREYESRIQDANSQKAKTQELTFNETKSKLSNENSFKNPFENNILNVTKSTNNNKNLSKEGNLRYSDENFKGNMIFIF